MAIHDLPSLGIRRDIIHQARAIVSRERILKSRSSELNKILGRLKAHLEEDEVVLVVHKDALKNPYIQFHPVTTEGLTVTTGNLHVGTIQPLRTVRDLGGGWAIDDTVRPEPVPALETLPRITTQGPF